MTITPSEPLPRHRSKAVQLPKIALPTFHGDLMEWAQFWSQFKQAVHNNPELTNPNKLAYLRDSIRDPDTCALLYCGTENDGYYDKMVDVLQQRFNQTRVIHANHCRTLADMKSVKHNRADLTKFANSVYTAVSGLKHTGQFDASPIITSLVVSALPKQLQEDWEERTEGSKQVPEAEDFVDFVRKKARNIAATPTTKAPEIKQENKSHHKKEYQPQRQKAAVDTSSAPPQPTASSSNSYQGFRYDCILCSDKHPLYLCTRCNQMTTNQRSEHLKGNRFCLNCLAPGHKTVDLLDAKCARANTMPWCIETLQRYNHYQQPRSLLPPTQ